MRLHRFYVGGEIELKHEFWLYDEKILHQWNRVLRFKANQEVVLFDGLDHDRLYKIVEITDKEAHLILVTELSPKTPKKDIYLLWSLLKKDKNDWVLQKCTELGVSHFMPILADRSEKTGFNVGRAKKIVIEASEQCGRSDIPNVREPIHLSAAIDELKDKITLLVCEQAEETQNAQLKTQNSQHITQNSQGVLVGPEGGWSDAEKQLFKDSTLDHLNLHNFTLRAETAAVTAVAKLII